MPAVLLSLPREKAGGRLWVSALILALVAQMLFLYHLGVPHQPVFDEIHYVRAARILAELSGPTNVEHPLLGKMFIAAGIKLFGDTSFGWRFFSTLAGTATVLAVFAITWLLLGRLRAAIVAAVLALLNFTLFVQARIAMLDGFMVALLLGAIAVFLWAANGRAARETVPRLALAGVLFGLAIGTKWAAVPFLGYAGLVMMVLRHAERGAADQHFGGVSAFTALAVLGGAGTCAYVATFMPAFFYRTDPLSWGGFVAFHQLMYAQQTQIVPPHPYQSVWWSWSLDLRPIWYLYERADGAQRGILMVGNPLVLWGGLAAVAACLYGWWRDKAAPLGVAAGLWIASYAIWPAIPKKIGFFYYYYLPSILLCIALAAAFSHFGRGRWRHADLLFSGAALVFFVYFFPILSAAPLVDDQAFLHWLLLPGWS